MARLTPAYVSLRDDMAASLRYHGVSQPSKVAVEILNDMEAKGYVITNRAKEVANGKG